jgi:DNA-binding NtrC family response regulator
VLQEKEIQRLGGNSTLKINVRVVAATNRCLEKEVAEGRFRLDLYYRLNVFPIQLPTLKDRKEDIEILANHFLRKYATSARKNVSAISSSALAQLMQYDWPGNIRELEHLIERNVLLAKTNEIEKFDLPLHTVSPLQENSGKLKTMKEMEKEHIMTALQNCGGKVSGPGGAAEVLQMQPQTLYSKMKKLGIKQGYS